MRSIQTSPDVPPVRIWKALDGSVPLFDDPTLTIKMLPWHNRPDSHLEVTVFRVETGQITQLDVEVAITLAKMMVLTEKQIRLLYAERYGKAHKLASRLRFLQQIGWFEGWTIESEYNKREYVWSIGFGAKNYLGFVMGMRDLPNPISIAQNIAHFLSVCAVNELRIQMLQRRIISEENFLLYPHLAPNAETPLAMAGMNTPVGMIVLYVERLRQNKKPLRYMKMKLKAYKDLIEKGRLVSPFPTEHPPILVWSSGTEEAVIDIVGSLSELPREMVHLFFIDEHMQDFRYAFRIAEKGSQVGDVLLKPFVFDFLEE